MLNCHILFLHVALFLMTSDCLLRLRAAMCFLLHSWLWLYATELPLSSFNVWYDNILLFYRSFYIRLQMVILYLISTTVLNVTIFQLISQKFTQHFSCISFDKIFFTCRLLLNISFKIATQNSSFHCSKTANKQ